MKKGKREYGSLHCPALEDLPSPDLEYIIIDGESTDKPVEIIKKYRNWLAYWESESEEGQSNAINKGWAGATGEIFDG